MMPSRCCTKLVELNFLVHQLYCIVIPLNSCSNEDVEAIGEPTSRSGLSVWLALAVHPSFYYNAIQLVHQIHKEIKFMRLC